MSTKCSCFVCFFQSIFIAWSITIAIDPLGPVGELGGKQQRYKLSCVQPGNCWGCGGKIFGTEEWVKKNNKLKALSLSHIFYSLTNFFLNRVECWAGPQFDAGTAEKVVIFDLFGSRRSIFDGDIWYLIFDLFGSRWSICDGDIWYLIFDLFGSCRSTSLDFTGGRQPVLIRMPWSGRRTLWRRSGHGCLGHWQQERRWWINLSKHLTPGSDSQNVRIEILNKYQKINSLDKRLYCRNLSVAGLHRRRRHVPVCNLALAGACLKQELRLPLLLLPHVSFEENCWRVLIRTAYRGCLWLSLWFFCVSFRVILILFA